MNEVITKKGKLPGKTSVIIAGIHGNEVCGVEAFKLLLPTLKIQRGTVHFIYGNPNAIKLGYRYTDGDLNRLFRSDGNFSNEERNSYEYHRSREILPYLDSADVLLDIHASNTEDSIPFFICENIAFPIIQEMGIETVVSGFDSLQPGGSDYYMNSRNAIGICLECGYVKDPRSTDIAVRGIQEFLVAQNHLEPSEDMTFDDKRYFEMKYMHLTKTDNFTPEKKFRDFEKVEKEQVIGRDGSEEIYAPDNGIVMFVRDGDGINQEAFLWGQEIKITL